MSHEIGLFFLTHVGLSWNGTHSAIKIPITHRHMHMQSAWMMLGISSRSNMEWWLLLLISTCIIKSKWSVQTLWLLCSRLFNQASQSSKFWLWCIKLSFDESQLSLSSCSSSKPARCNSMSLVRNIPPCHVILQGWFHQEQSSYRLLWGFAVVDLGSPSFCVSSFMFSDEWCWATQHVVWFDQKCLSVLVFAFHGWLITVACVCWHRTQYCMHVQPQHRQGTCQLIT